MSGTYDHLKWAESQRCGGPGPKAVLLTVARMAGLQDDGVTWACFPSQSLLADITEQSVRTVRTQLAGLEAAGFVVRTHRTRAIGKGRGRTTDLISLAFQAADASSESDDLAASGESSSGKSEHDSAATRCRAEEPVEEPVEEPTTITRPKAKIEPHADAQRLADLLADLIADDDVKRPNVSAAWVTEIDRMIRLDEIPPDTVEGAVRWSQQHQFWSGVVLSPAKLRKHFAAMAKQSKQEKRGRSGGHDPFAGIEEFLADLDRREGVA